MRKEENMYLHFFRHLGEITVALLHGGLSNRCTSQGECGIHIYLHIHLTRMRTPPLFTGVPGHDIGAFVTRHFTTPYEFTIT